MKKQGIFRNVFKLHKLRESLRLAMQGIVYLFLFHNNMRLIFLLGLLAFLLGIYLKLKAFEFMLLCLTVSMVFVAEMFNSAIELIIDMFTDKYHILIKVIKDISAAVVLIASLNALAIGYFLFFRRILSLLR